MGGTAGDTASAGVTFRPMLAADYDAAATLWNATPGMGLDPEMDSRAGITAYLVRNPGLSFVAIDGDGSLAGTVLAGTDGRRGYLMHLAVAPALRRKGIGRSLVAASLDALLRAGINKAHVFVFKTNESGRAFWEGLGWEGRDDLAMLSMNLDSGGVCC